MEISRILNFIFFFFAAAGAVDYFLDNSLGIGEDFHRGIECAGKLTMCMVGMLTLSILFSDWMMKIAGPFLTKVGSDPSLLAGVLFAVDCGGAPAAEKMALSNEAVLLNGYLVAAMFGSALSGQSFLQLMAVKKEKRRFVLLGLAFGFASIPFGCAIGAAAEGMSLSFVVKDLLPLVILSVILVAALMLCTEVLLKVLNIFGKLNIAMCLTGLLIAALGELCGIEILPERYPFKDIMGIIGNIVLVLAGVFPMMGIALRLFKRQIAKLSEKADLSVTDINGVLSCLVSSFASIEKLPEMTDFGIIINVAFSIGAGYVFGDHFAYVSSARPEFVLPVILSKLAAGAISLLAAFLLRTAIIKEKRSYER